MELSGTRTKLLLERVTFVAPKLQTLFHGGRPNLKYGQWVLPPSVTRHKCASDYGAKDVHRRNRVYVTPSMDAAAMFASLYPAGFNAYGWVYEVKPFGDIDLDPDCSDIGLSFECLRAKVVRRIHIPTDKMCAIRAEMLNKGGRWWRSS